jgi:DNA-binding response OmpR family regulator
MRILMLEYDARLLAAVTRTLEQHGVRVVGTHALDTARRLLAIEHFDAALLDCDSLEPDDLLSFTDFPLILVTSFLGHEGAHRFFGHGLLLPKPYTSAQILSALKDALGTLGSEPQLLVDVLRRAHSDAESVGFCVGEAQLFIEQGELVHAELGGLSGEAALAEVLAEGNPRARRIPARAVERTINRPFQTLLLDLLQRIDEREQEAWESSPVQRGTKPPPGGSRS